MVTAQRSILKITNVRFNTHKELIVMTTYGYVRISRPQQSIDRQIRNIKAKYPTAIIVSEAYTGTIMNRPKWTKLVKAIKPDDKIVFDKALLFDDGHLALYSFSYLFCFRPVFLLYPFVNEFVYISYRIFARFRNRSREHIMPVYEFEIAFFGDFQRVL